MKRLFSFLAVFAVFAVIAVPIMIGGIAGMLHEALFYYMRRAGLVLGINDFGKEEVIAFERMLEGFQDALVLSKAVSIYNTDQVMMERAADVFWRPMPYIAQSFDGTDQTANFRQNTQMLVPATIGYAKSVPWTLSATELRDMLQEQRITSSAHQKLASDINVAINKVATAYGSLVVKRTSAATGFDDVAQAEAIMNEQGVQQFDRYMGISTRDYNGMASNLAGRQTMTGLPQTAYEKALIPGIVSFEAYKMDYTPRIAAAGGVGTTLNAANQYYIPKAKSIAASGEMSPVDNRFQTITVNSTTNVLANDCFTVAGVNAVHHITKGDTGQLKTFRVVQVVDATHLVITPPMISAGGGTDAEKQYQNVTATPASNAAITWLNTAAGYLNPFWQKDAIELLPGRYAVPEDAGAAVLRASTDQGIEVVLQKFYDINTMVTKYRADVRFGTVNKQPEMSGVMLFSQP